MNITIIGAGMAGLLAARILELRGHQVLIYEKQKKLPNNHNAVLRFRSNIISEITGIEFEKVKMIKATVPYLNPVAEALAYSNKAFGSYRTDRSINNGLTVADRYIAPSDFISQLAEKATIQFETEFDLEGLKADVWPNAIISTMPMPSLMNHLKYDHGSSTALFQSYPGKVIKAHIKDCYAFATLYVPDPEYPFYRISITGDELICECPDIDIYDHKSWALLACKLLGINTEKAVFFEPEVGAGLVQVIAQPYAKIEPIDDIARKKFMAWATDQHNIYSLGRFATWRPGLLLDDLVQDIKLIEKWITKGDKYDIRKAR